MAWVNTSPLVKTYTLEEFWQLPDAPDGAKLELIAGVLYMSPPPDYVHDDVVARVYGELYAHKLAKGIAGTFYVPRAAIWSGPNTYLEPDLFYVSAELAATMPPDRRTTADIVIEVVSTGSAMYDRNTKADTYGALGVRELWLIDDKHKTVEVRIQTGSGFDAGVVYRKGECLVSLVFPELSLAVDTIFPN